MFGIDIQPVNFGAGLGAVGEAAVSAGDLEDNLSDASKKAKELKNALLGIDELNVLSPPDDSSSGGIGNSIGGGGFDVGSLWDESIFAEVNKQVDEIIGKIKEWLGIADGIDSWAELFDTRLGRILSTVGMIGASFATWKIATGVSTLIDKISKMGEKGSGLGYLLLLADSMSHLMDCVQDILENGANFDNVSGIITEFATGMGAALTALGNVKRWCIAGNRRYWQHYSRDSGHCQDR